MTDEIWAYLDTNVVISLAEAMDGVWRPPSPPVTRTDRQRLSAARIFFYGYNGRWTNWYLVTSSEARRELRDASLAWIDVMFPEVDQTADQIDPEALRVEVQRYEVEGVGRADATHLAHASLRPWVRFFITDDDRLRKRSARAGLPDHLQVLSSTAAEERLEIAEGETPPIVPHPSSPLARERWWVPGQEYT